MWQPVSFDTGIITDISYLPTDVFGVRRRFRSTIPQANAVSERNLPLPVHNLLITLSPTL